MNEKYSEQGDRLTKFLRSALVSEGFCDTMQQSQKLLPGTAGHGDKVRIACYEIRDGNLNALTFLIGMIVNHGIGITGGVPITIAAYRESLEQHRRSGIFSCSEPFLILELNE